MKLLVLPVVLMIAVVLIAPTYGQDIWNVYCNGDSSKCTIAEDPNGELMSPQFTTPVDWDTAQAWMDEWRANNKPAVWNVYCNGDSSKCAIAKAPSGDLMSPQFTTPVDWDTAQAWMTEWRANNKPAVWNVYCNGGSSKCTIAKGSSGELMFPQFTTPVDWDTAQAWMAEWRANNKPAVWNVYCNGDSSKCAIAKAPSGDLMSPQFTTLVDWDTAQAWMAEWEANNQADDGSGSTSNRDFYWIGMEDDDKISEWDSGNPDGHPDGHFVLNLDLPTSKEIKSILVYSADESGNPLYAQFWDTAAKNYWMLGVFDHGTQLNKHHITSLGTFTGHVQLDLYCDDSGYFKQGRYFGLEVNFGDGTKLKRLVSIS